jgi:hypothetical protein
MAEPTAANGQATDAMTQQQIGSVTQVGNMALQNAVAFQQAMNTLMLEKLAGGCSCSDCPHKKGKRG